MTGSHKYNIDYDKGITRLPDVLGDHDPVRARLTIRTLPQVPQSPRSLQPPVRSDGTPGHGESVPQPNDKTTQQPLARKELKY